MTRRPSMRSRPVVGSVVAMLLATVIAGCDTTQYIVDGCAPADRGSRSVARVWNELLLDLIRQVVPAPTVHARNLFHLSAAMWDAWAVYDPVADGVFVTEKLHAEDVPAAREAAMSYAAYRILRWRYVEVSDLPEATAQLDAAMASLCYRPDVTTVEGDSPAALGNRIAAAVLEAGRGDGAREEERYLDPSYTPVNDPLVVDEPGAVMRDPNRWQPLSLGEQLSQNGLPIPGHVQVFIGSHWGRVTPFALPPSPDGLPIDPGPPPHVHDAATDDEFKAQAIEVIRRSSELDPSSGVTIDIGPGALGDNPLGTNDGHGHAMDPATGRPYPPNRVALADYGRALAEYWADGPRSETPPGHWNVIANEASDALAFPRAIGGEGQPVDRLEWDVKLYLALNGAVHDAAIAAWGVKSRYDSVRPISMIRWMGGNGQSSDPSGPAYDPDGLPLVDGLVEVVTAESSAPGERHAHLADHVGEVAIRAWRGFPDDPKTQTSGVGWIRAVEWVPYQRPTFVTPAFAGYVSGHSTFSRAAAEVLSAMTADPFFPGGQAEWTVPAGELLHEEGPTADVTLQWATYRDAADEAGRSRIFMGIHIAADDFEGRRIGERCGLLALDQARRHFDGSARP